MKKIIIADDREENRYLLINFFKLFGPDAGLQIFEASSGNQAFELAQKEKPDLLIIDLKMETESDGIETIKKIKNDKNISNICIWVLTAQIMNEDVFNDDRNKSSSFCDEYILKPFDHIELLRKAADYLEIPIPQRILEKLNRD